MHGYIKNYKDSTVQWRSTKKCQNDNTSYQSCRKKKQIKWVFVYFFLPHWKKIFAASWAHVHQWKWNVLFSAWKISKEANDNMFDMSGTSCLSITVLPAKNAGQVKDRLAALSACSHFWIATYWNQFSHKVKVVINELSCGNARYAPHSCGK